MINFFVRILSNTAFTHGLLRVLPWPALQVWEVMSSGFFKNFFDWKIQFKITTFPNSGGVGRALVLNETKPRCLCGCLLMHCVFFSFFQAKFSY
jgi:hypothetical protein